MRATSFASLAFAIAVMPAVARADGAPSKSACVDAYTRAQEASRSGALSQARAAALLCARDPCPAVLQKDCSGWLAEVEQRMPTILVVLRDADGKDISAARVSIDGAAVASRLDGRPIEIDPGEHKIEVVTEGSPPFEQTIIAREREKGREVAFAFKPRTPRPATGGPSGATVVPPPEKASERPLPWTFWAASGTSAAGLVVFGIFGASGLGIRSDLDACKPNCAQDRIDHGKTSFLVADVSLVVGVLAAGIATYLYLLRP